MPSGDQIDLAIMAAVANDWLKVARIVAIVGQHEASGGVSDEFIAERIAYLVKQGRLESQGDLSNWRHSEIRRAG